MGTALATTSIDPAPTAYFKLDSHHVALLDRFVARAQRHARRNGEQFTGVVIEIDLSRPVSVHASDQASLVLRLEPCVAG